ncbi:hypothetical protein LG302_13230 [Halomonas organivorans]
MDTLIAYALRFPLIVFTVLLGLLALYWLLVLLRLAPLELFEHDSLRNDNLASALVSLGFAGVPASLALTVLIGLAGLLTLGVEVAVLTWLPLGLFRIPLGVLVLWAAFALASPLAAAICHRLHRPLHRHPERHPRCLLGEVVRVTAKAEDDGRTRAVLEEDEARDVCLLGKPGERPTPGERRVLVKYLPEAGAFRAVPEREFLDARTRLVRLHLLGRHHGPGSRNGGSASA